MNNDLTQDPRAAAVEQLEQFGLTAYAAETFVALSVLGASSARDVSQVSDVPRTRVYDAVDELQDRGLVEVQQSTPKKFWAISAETASQTFERELEHRHEIFRTAMDELEPIERRTEQRGVWTVDGRPAVTKRLLEFFEAAENEIVYVTTEELLTDDLLAGLREAANRDVAVNISGVSPSDREFVRETMPAVTMFETPGEWGETPASRLMMVDGAKTLVSVFVDEADETAPDARSETAIWAEGRTNGLVVVLKVMLDWRFETPGTDSR